MEDSSSPQLQDGGELGQMASATPPSDQLLQTECEALDPLVSCPEDTSEQGSQLPKDPLQQWSTLPLQTPVTGVIPPAPSLQPDPLSLTEISCCQSDGITTPDIEKTPAIHEDAKILIPAPLEQALGKAPSPLGLQATLTLSPSLKPADVSEFQLENPAVVQSTSEKQSDRLSASTEKLTTITEDTNVKSTNLIPSLTEKSPAEKSSGAVDARTEEASITVATSEKNSENADCSGVLSSAGRVFEDKSTTLVPTPIEKAQVVTESTEKLKSEIASSSEKALLDCVNQLQKSSEVPVTSPQSCLSLDAAQVQEPQLLKPSSCASEGGILSFLDAGKQPASLPITSPDQSSPVPTVITDQTSSPHPSSKNSSPPSSVTPVEKVGLPYSTSGQDSSLQFDSSGVLSKEDGLPQGGSISSSSQDVRVCSSVESGNQDHLNDAVDGCESNKRTDSTLNIGLEGEGFSCGNRILDDSSEVVNSEQEMQIDEPDDCWNDVDSSREAAMETMPLIVDTHTLRQDDVDQGHSTVNSNSEVNSNFVCPSVLPTPQTGVSNVNTVPLLESEPLQPVTIGSSLQPLQEVQEASVLDDPSFAAELTLMDSSADEADSIGGLVINSVIGAADGVVDFHPDEDMETDRELTDISASAPQIVGGACDNDSSDETGPSAKRMRFENGIGDLDDKLQGAKKVVFKVTPVKSGDELWDSHKLHQVLLTNGTILLRLHASADSVDMFEPDSNDKENEKVDFTGILCEAKEEDHDHILGLANLEPDADVYDPLAIGSTHAADHTSPPHYIRPFPHSRGRSTALQPAMSRPGFRHLQSPPH
ncbi:hypothetical protein Hamer_G030754, partial [Homarus americanus]